MLVILAVSLSAVRCEENSDADVIIKFESGEMVEAIDAHEQTSSVAEKANKTDAKSEEKNSDDASGFSLWNFLGFSGNSNEVETKTETIDVITEPVADDASDVITIDDADVIAEDVLGANSKEDEDYDLSFYYQADDQFWNWGGEDSVSE